MFVFWRSDIPAAQRVLAVIKAQVFTGLRKATFRMLTQQSYYSTHTCSVGAIFWLKPVTTVTRLEQKSELYQPLESLLYCEIIDKHEKYVTVFNLVRKSNVVSAL